LLLKLKLKKKKEKKKLLKIDWMNRKKKEKNLQKKSYLWGRIN